MKKYSVLLVLSIIFVMAITNVYAFAAEDKYYVNEDFEDGVMDDDGLYDFLIPSQYTGTTMTVEDLDGNKALVIQNSNSTQQSYPRFKMTGVSAGKKFVLSFKIMQDNSVYNQTKGNFLVRMVGDDKGSAYDYMLRYNQDLNGLKTWDSVKALDTVTRPVSKTWYRYDICYDYTDITAPKIEYMMENGNVIATDIAVEKGGTEYVSALKYIEIKINSWQAGCYYTVIDDIMLYEPGEVNTDKFEVSCSEDGNVTVSNSSRMFPVNLDEITLTGSGGKSIINKTSISSDYRSIVITTNGLTPGKRYLLYMPSNAVAFSSSEYNEEFSLTFEAEGEKSAANALKTVADFAREGEYYNYRCRVNSTSGKLICALYNGTSLVSVDFPDMDSINDAYVYGSIKSDELDNPQIRVFSWSDTASMVPLAQDKETESLGALTAVYPQDSSAPVKNPNKGFFYPFGTMTLEAIKALDESILEYTNLIYIRTEWRVMNPGEDEYNFDKLDAILEYCKSKNLKVFLGFMPVNVNSTASNSYESTPEWVFDKGCAYTTVNIEDKNIRVPVWTDSIYKASLEKFINAMQERYDGNETIFAIEDRNYGNWGEGHLGNLTGSIALTDAQLRELMALWDVFEETKIIVLGGTYNDIIKDMVLEKGRLLKRDGLFNPNHRSQTYYYDLAYDNVIALGEWYDQNWSYANQIINGTWDRAYYESTIIDNAVTYLGYNGGTQFAEDEEELIKRVYNKIGYTFKMPQIRYSTNLGNGSRGVVDFTIKNTGSAPFFGDNSGVKAALMDDSYNVLETVVLENVNLYDWKPDEVSYEKAYFTFNANGNASKLALGLFSDINSETPDIMLAAKDEVCNGWYVLNDMTAVPDKNKAAFAVMTASSYDKNADYGIYRADYASDGSLLTYWRSNSDSEQILTANFYEQKQISGVNISGAENIISFEVEYLRDGLWETAYLGSANELGTDILFDTVRTSAVRLNITESLGNVTVSEFKIY